MQPNQSPVSGSPANQVQLSSSNHQQQSLSGNLLLTASSFSPRHRAASSPLSALNSSAILHPPLTATIHPNSHLVHPNQLISPSSINAHGLPLPQSVLQSAQLLRNNYDSLFYVNGQLPGGKQLDFNGQPAPINFSAICQLNQLSHQLNQIPIAAASMCAAAASLHSLQQQQQNCNSSNADNTSDNLSVCSNLSGSMKSEDTTLNNSSCGGFSSAFKLSGSLKNSNGGGGGGLLGATANGQLSSTAGQLRANASTPNAVNELKFSVNSILNASNYGGTQLRNDGKSPAS